MLRMRTEQMDAFKDAQFARLDGELVRYAAARFPVEAQRLDAAALRAQVTAIRARCQTHGFQSTEAFALGVDFVYLHGDAWFDAPWALPMLRAGLLPEPLRLKVLRNAAPGEGR